MKITQIIFNIFVVFTFSACIFSHENKIIKYIESISQQDREILKDFFHKLLFYQGFAYTLFGDKPISIEIFDLEEKHKELFSISSEGYKAWKKYAHLFSSPNYIFIFDEDLEKDRCEITLINTKAFHQVIKDHSHQFVKIFGPHITSKHLLHLLIRKRSLWNTAMNNHQDVIGILLGYGKINAALYHQRSEINSKTLGIKKRRTKPSFGYSSIEEELNALNATLHAFSDEERFSFRFMRLPGFVADSNSLETKKLKQKYIEQRRNITQKYAREDALKITLEQLCLSSN